MEKREPKIAAMSMNRARYQFATIQIVDPD
jgi:hypothetical protein